MIIESGTYSVYVHTNMINGKIYVGTTKKVPAYKRWGLTGIGYKKNKRFYDDISEFGWKNFESEIVASGLNEAEASNMERILIGQLETQDPNKGYNFEKGGLRKNEASRAKKISESTKGKNHHHFGKPQSDETREKISRSLSGENNIWYGKHLPEETRQKIREKSLNQNYAQRLKDAAKRRQVKVLCVETGVEYESIKEAATLSGANPVTISRVLKGQQETSGGYHWIKK